MKACKLWSVTSFPWMNKVFLNWLEAETWLICFIVKVPVSTETLSSWKREAAVGDWSNQVCVVGVFSSLPLFASSSSQSLPNSLPSSPSKHGAFSLPLFHLCSDFFFDLHKLNCNGSYRHGSTSSADALHFCPDARLPPRLENGCLKRCALYLPFSVKAKSLSSPERLPLSAVASCLRLKPRWLVPHQRGSSFSPSCARCFGRRSNNGCYCSV